MASAQLALVNVSIGFGDGNVLSNASLEVAKGESVVLIGPSGKGKTVVLKLFAGLLPPDQGAVLIEGKNLQAIRNRERVELLLKMGMLFQKIALFDSLSVGENIAFPLKAKGMKRQEREDEAMKGLVRMRLDECRKALARVGKQHILDEADRAGRAFDIGEDRSYHLIGLAVGCSTFAEYAVSMARLTATGSAMWENIMLLSPRPVTRTSP